MGNSRKNKSRVFGLETFSEFSHIIKSTCQHAHTAGQSNTKKHLPWRSVDKEI